MISWDTETHPIKAGMPAPRLVCYTAAEHGREPVIHMRDQGLDIIEERMLDEPSVGHNIFYDLGVAVAERPHLMPKIFDALDRGSIECTQIRQMMIDNARGELKFEWDEEKEEFKKQRYDLGRLVQRHLGWDIGHKKKGDGIWRLRYNELDGVPLQAWPKEARDYAIDDSVLALAVHESQEQNDIAPDEIPGFASQMQAAWGLDLMSMWGVRTDPVAVAEYRKELEIDYAKQVKECQKYGFRRTPKREEGKKSRDMKVIRASIESWYKDNGKQFKLTKTGQIATDREQLTDTDHPGLHAVAESVKVEKQLTTYIAALERATEVPLNPRYNPIIETFRTSCSGGMKIDKVPVGMNLQNLPRKGKVRECVIPRYGNVFAFCDYDTLELRTLAQVCIDWFGHSEMKEAVRADQDLHVALAADMEGIPYGEAKRLYDAGDPHMDTVRQFCKIGNYGLAGGMGARTFVSYAKNSGVIVSPEVAQRVHAGFRRKWHVMNQYFNYCSTLCREGRAEKVVFARSGMVRGNVTYTATCNGFFQHLAAMGAKEAVYEVARECYVDAGSPLFGCRPWLFAHDEIGMEVPYLAFGPQRSHEAAVRLQEVMIECMQHWCPDIPIGATVVMTRRWFKGAKPVYVNGILVPCKKQGKVWVADG